MLNDVSFTVNDGDFVAFVGTNGGGEVHPMRLANGLPGSHLRGSAHR